MFFPLSTLISNNHPRYHFDFSTYVSKSIWIENSDRTDYFFISSDCHQLYPKTGGFSYPFVIKKLSHKNWILKIR